MTVIDRPDGLPPLLGEERLDPGLLPLVASLARGRATPGWATVELERAARELAAATAPASDGSDELLGASARLVRTGSLGVVVLLEPSTEGPLAAALARHGEGWLAAYVPVDEEVAVPSLRAAGQGLSAAGPGPLGRQRRLLAGPRDGPFILLVPHP